MGGYLSMGDMMGRLGMETCKNAALKIENTNGKKFKVKAYSLSRGLAIQLLFIKILCSSLGVGMGTIQWTIYSSIAFCQITGMKFIGLMALLPSHDTGIQA